MDFDFIFHNVILQHPVECQLLQNVTYSAMLHAPCLPRKFCKSYSPVKFLHIVVHVLINMVIIRH